MTQIPTSKFMFYIVLAKGPCILKTDTGAFDIKSGLLCDGYITGTQNSHFPC